MNDRDISHLQLFQRFDRARKGYIIHSDIADFLKEYSAEKLSAKDISRAFPDQKTKHQAFVKVLLDLEAIKAEHLVGNTTFMSISPLLNSEIENMNFKEQFLQLCT